MPVRAIMHRHGLARSPECPRATCTGVETIRHAMWDCAFAGGVWGRLGVLLERVEGGFSLSWEVVHRGIMQKNGQGQTGFLLWLVVSLGKRGLWLARQDLVQRNRDSGVGMWSSGSQGT